jgi:hypothetical protein
MVDLSVPVTQTVFGRMVGVSQQAVSDLLARGVLTEGADAATWIGGAQEDQKADGA